MVKILERNLEDETLLTNESESEYIHAKNQLAQYLIIQTQNHQLRKDFISKERGMI